MWPKNNLTYFIIHIFVICYSRAKLPPTTAGYTHEKNLYTTLLSDYQASVRPAKSVSEPVHVEFQIRLVKLREYDLKSQVLTVTIFTMMHWEDPQLTWNASDYGGIEFMNFLSSEIWTPDVVLYNSAYEERESWTDIYPSKTLVTNSGQVIWNMPVIWYVACQSDITWFPVDRQTCTLQYGSWSYSYMQLRLVPWKKNSTAPVRILRNGQWSIQSQSGLFVNATFTCCPYPFSQYNHTIVFDHLSSYYFIYIILPMGALCTMFPLTFFIPVDSGERLGFGITVILSVSVYLLVISDKLPEKSDVKPMLGIIFVGEFFILCFGLMISSISVIFHSNQKRGPTFLRKLARVTHRQRRRRDKNEIAMAANVNNGFDVDDYKQRGSQNPDYTGDYNTSAGKSAKVKRIKEEWEILSRFLDRFGFIFTSTMIVLYPVVVCLSLSSDNLQ